MWNHSYPGGHLRPPNGEIYEPHIGWSTRRSRLGIPYSKGNLEHLEGRQLVGGSLWAAAHRENNVYFFQGLHQAHMMSQLISYPALGSEKQLRRTDTQGIEIWHRRMGHLNRKYISILKSLADSMDFGSVRKHKLDCEESLPREQHEHLAKLIGLVFGVEEKKTCYKCSIIFPLRNELHKHFRVANHYCNDSTPSLSDPNWVCRWLNWVFIH